MYFNAPYGYPTVIYNYNRIYDEGRLGKILNGFQFIEKVFSYEGQIVEESVAQNKKATKIIKNFYTNIEPDKRTYDSPSGIMVLLRKVK